jgi:hypothetical protein
VGHDLVLADGYLASSGGQWRSWTARAISLNKGKPPEPQTDTHALENSINYIIGASMLITRGFYERVGKMREDYFLYCEEVEWCLRAIAKGMRLGFASDAWVLHYQGTTTGAGGEASGRSRLSVYLGERNKVLTTRDRFPARLPIAALASLAIHAWRFARRGAWAQFGYGLAGWWGGLRGERGVPKWMRG